MDAELLAELKRRLDEGEFGEGTQPRTVIDAAVNQFLELASAMEALRELPEPIICPMCLRSTVVVPITTTVWPLWVEVGHSGRCPVHAFRKERALARRQRWAKQYRDVPSKRFIADLTGADNLERLEEFLDITTQFPMSLREVRDTRGIEPHLPTKDMQTTLDQGQLTDEARRAYAAIRTHLQEICKGKKPKQIAGPNANPRQVQAAQDYLSTVRALPAPESVLAVEAKAVFHELRQGILEYAYKASDKNRPLIEYASSQLGILRTHFTAEERKALLTNQWAKHLLLLVHDRRAPPSRPVRAENRGG